MSRPFLALALLLSIGGRSAHGQLVVPEIPFVAAGKSSLPISAAEAAYHVQARDERTRTDVAFRRAYPVDSMRAVTTHESMRWLSTLKTTTVRGLQLDPSGRVGVAAEDEAYAKAQIAARLATPGLSFADKAFTLVTAVRAFSSQYYPARLPIAETYLAALDAMGDSAASWQFEARVPLAAAYYQLGRTADVIRHGVRALSRSTVIPFLDRNVVFRGGGGRLYQETVAALTGQPGGRAEIDRLFAALRAAAELPTEVAALDPSFADEAQGYKRLVDNWIAVATRLGTKGDSLAASVWLNRPGAGASTVAVNDGKIRVIEIGTYGCPPCIEALFGMQRLHEKFPDIEVSLATFLLGFWANRHVDAKEETEHLTNYFLNTAKLTFPISIWQGEKTLNEDGGMTIEDFGPNMRNYPISGKPMLWVLDGTGTVRQVFMGYSRDVETQIGDVVQFLRREAGANRDANSNTAVSLMTTAAVPAVR